MNWWRGVFRLWVGVVAIVVGAFLFGSISNAIYAPQTNDAAEFLTAAGIVLAIGLFGAWVLRGMKGDPAR